jgi:hypothetical protein
MLLATLVTVVLSLGSVSVSSAASPPHAPTAPTQLSSRSNFPAACSLLTLALARSVEPLTVRPPANTVSNRSCYYTSSNFKAGLEFTLTAAPLTSIKNGKETTQSPDNSVAAQEQITMKAAHKSAAFDNAHDLHTVVKSFSGLGSKAFYLLETDLQDGSTIVNISWADTKGVYALDGNAPRGELTLAIALRLIGKLHSP